MFGIELQTIEGVILAFLRIGTALALMPVFGYNAIPVQVKAGVAFILAMTLAPVLGDHVYQAPPGVMAAATAALGEIMVGMVFGLVTLLVLIGAEYAGSIVGLQMGFGIVNVMDPQSGRQVQIIGRLEYLVALIIFISLDFHLHFLSVLASSFELIPLGGILFSEAVSINYAQLTAQIFVIAVKIAAPVMAMLLLTEVSLGFIARTMPQMNVFIIGFPLKIGLGMIGLAISWPLFVYVISKVFRMFENELKIILSTMAGT